MRVTVFVAVLVVLLVTVYATPLYTQEGQEKADPEATAEAQAVVPAQESAPETTPAEDVPEETAGGDSKKTEKAAESPAPDAKLSAEPLSPAAARREKYGTSRGTDDRVFSPLAPGQTALPQGDIGEGVYLNATEIDVKELIKQLSKAAGKNFLLDDKIRGKVTIISESKMTMEEAYQAFLSALSVAGYTTVEGPGNLIKVVPRKEAIQYPIRIYKGTSPMTDDFITRVITLSNISALELSNVVKGLISKDGNLLAYPATNTLIITDTGTNIARLMEIVKELDKEGPQQIIQIIPIQYATAKDITDKLNQLFAQGEDKTSRSTRRRKRGESAGDQEDIPAISNIIPDDRTNSIIVFGSKRGIADLLEVIAKLDTPLEGAEGTIHVHYLQHAVASELASVLSSLASGAGANVKKKGKAAATSEGGGTAAGDAIPTAEFEGGLKITADENTNSLVIVASPKDYQTLVDKVIAKLDIPRRQVYLEAIVMELSATKLSNFTPRFLGGKPMDVVGDSKEEIIGFGSLFGGAGAFTDFATTVGSLGGLAGGFISSDSINVPITDSSGASSTVSVPALGLIIHAVQENQTANVLSTPSLLTLDNEEAEIFVGSNVPFQTGNAVNATGTTTTVTREDVGIGLKITPQINESDTIRLQITQEVDNVAAASLADPNGPTTFKRSVNTVVVAENQQTVVIGGLLQDNSSMGISKVPLFGDIPLLGNLFKSRNKRREKSNILVFITPYIIRDRSDFMVILKRKLEERNNFIDHNYGRRQAKGIREDISRHAAHLLTYSEGQLSPYAKPVPGASTKAPGTAPGNLSSGAAPLEKEVIHSEKRQGGKYKRMQSSQAAPRPGSQTATPQVATPGEAGTQGDTQAPTSDSSVWSAPPPQ